MHEFFWREDEDGVIVLEFLRTDLAAVIRGAGSEKIDGGEVKGLMMQMVSGVHACHQNRIVHRDLKPENFLISDDGVVKLADFGQVFLDKVWIFEILNFTSFLCFFYVYVFVFFYVYVFWVFNECVFCLIVM
jgi:hypothetical protein